LLTDAAAGALASAFERLSRARGKRIFHPFGVGFAATLEPVGGGGTATPDGGASGGGAQLPFLHGPAVEAKVRMSRALGLPEWLPDPCGLALRVEDAYGEGRHQDLLLVTSALAPISRHLPLPSRHFVDRPYSSLLPYRFEGELLLLGARCPETSDQSPRLAELRQRQVGGLDFELLVASLVGQWLPVARLALGNRLPPEETERLGFDPTNTGGGLELAGIVNRLRGPSYRGSQEGRTWSG
jgi:hypothetical protein